MLHPALGDAGGVGRADRRSPTSRERHARHRGRAGYGRSVKLSARALNRATLARQLLLQRRRLGVVDALKRVVALQGQEPASPHLALWNRIDGFDPDELHRAVTDQRIVKTQLFRITLHAVTAADYRPSTRRCRTRSAGRA